MGKSLMFHDFSYVWRSALCMASLVAAAACTDPETARQQALERGDRFAGEGRYNEAILEYRNAVRQDARSGEARLKLAEAYARTQNGPAALREYVRAADLMPENVEAQVTAGVYLLLAQQFEEAKTRAEQALARQPDHVDALIVRANAMAGLKDVDGAIQDIEEALEARGEDGRMLTSLGALRLARGQQVEAETTFLKAIQVDPKALAARVSLANFYWSSGRPQDAERTLHAAREIDPSDPMVNRMLAALYMATGRPAEAEAPLKRMAEKDGGVALKAALGEYDVQMNRIADATAILKPLSEADPPFSPATLQLAGIEYQAGRSDAARALLDQVLQREPRYTNALILRASWYLREGNVRAALDSGHAAVESDPASASAQYVLGQALAQNRQPDAAIKVLNEVARLNPRMAAAQLLLSRLELATGNVAAAAASATEAKRAAPQNLDVRLALARSLVAQGRLSQADPEVKSLIAEHPQVPHVQAVHGMLLMGRRDEAGARAAFRRALDRDPNFPDALQGLMLLDSQSGNLEAAIVRIEERVTSQPKSAPLQFIAARTYAAARQPEKMEKALKAGLEIDPDNVNAYMLLGSLYTSQKRLDSALAEFETAASRRPDQVGAATMAATILQMQGKEAEAQKRYEAILAGSPQAAVAANNLAWSYAERGERLDRALELAQQAKARLPDVAEVNDTLGWVYYKAGLAAAGDSPARRERCHGCQECGISAAPGSGLRQSRREDQGEDGIDQGARAAAESRRGR